MDNAERAERLRAIATEAFSRVNAALKRQPAPEAEAPRRPTIHQARVTPDNAVAKWAAEGRRLDAMRKAADAEREADERREIETKQQAALAAANDAERAYIQDMLPVVQALDEALKALDQNLDAIEMRAAKRSQQREMFHWKNHRRADRDLHEQILADGDHAKAEAVSRNVMKRIGLSDEDIAALQAKRH